MPIRWSCNARAPAICSTPWPPCLPACVPQVDSWPDADGSYTFEVMVARNTPSHARPSLPVLLVPSLSNHSLPYNLCIRTPHVLGHLSQRSIIREHLSGRLCDGLLACKQAHGSAAMRTWSQGCLRGREPCPAVRCAPLLHPHRAAQQQCHPPDPASAASLTAACTGLYAVYSSGRKSCRLARRAQQQLVVVGAKAATGAGGTTLDDQAHGAASGRPVNSCNAGSSALRPTSSAPISSTAGAQAVRGRG